MAARQNYYAESTAESTTTSTSYQDKTTLTFTPDDSATYFIFATWLHTNSSTSHRQIANLIRTSGTPVTFSELDERNFATNEYRSGFVVGIDAFGASPGEQTYKIQHKSSNASGTEKIKEAKILAIKKDSLDEYAESLTRATTTSTVSYVDGVTKTFTPGTTGDYIIFAQAVVDSSATNRFPQVKLNVDGTETGFQQLAVRDTATGKSYFGTLVKVNLTNSSHTIKLQYKISASGTMGITNQRLIILRADVFENVYYDEDDARTTTTAGTYQDKSVLTQTPEAFEHVIFGADITDNSDISTGYSTYTQLIEGATVIAEQIHQGMFDSSHRFPYVAMYRKTLAASSTTWKTQHKDENATAGIAYSRILLLQTDAASTISNKIVSINQAVKRSSYF